MSYYPSGHPTGTTHSWYESTCPACSRIYRVKGEYERDTNALTLDEDDDFMCECGAYIGDGVWDEQR